MSTTSIAAASLPQEHDYEPIRGLPGQLPPGETILWQGAPRAPSLARYGFHLGLLAVYFAVLLAWCAGHGVGHALGSAQGFGGLLLRLAELVGLAFAALGLVALFSWLVARTTVYTITSRRVVLRFGIAFQLSLNLPFAAIDGADLRRFADGTGNLALGLSASSGMGYVVMWPHVRPWRLARAQPMLRSIPDAERVARILGRALAAAAAQPAPAMAPGSASGLGEEPAPARLPGSAVAA